MAGSTLAARALGRKLAEYRENAKLTRNAASRIVETSPQTVARAEDGLKAKVPDLWINAWADAYECTDEQRQLLLSLAHEMRSAQKSWWRGHEDEIPTDFNHYISLEDSASKLTFWAANLVPGLLQTPDYRRTLAWAENPSWTHDEVERRVAVATKRQERLADPKLEVHVLLSEAALRNQVGGDSVMDEQLTRLLAIGQLPNVTLQVVPFKASSPIGPLISSFVLLEFPVLPATKIQEPPVVYIDGHVGGLYLERDTEVGQYREDIGRIASVALDTTETGHTVGEIKKEYAQ
jgi:DNA-binding XRE family transcriptional regulator